MICHDCICNLKEEMRAEYEMVRKIVDMKFQRIRGERLSTRTVDALTRNGIVTIADLINYTEKDLMAIQGFGNDCLMEVISLVDTLGLRLKKERQR